MLSFKSNPGSCSMCQLSYPEFNAKSTAFSRVLINIYSVQVHVDMYLWEVLQCVFIYVHVGVYLCVYWYSVCISSCWYTNQHPARHFVFLRSSSCLNSQIVSVSRKKLHSLPPSEDLKENTLSSPPSSSLAFNWRDFSLRSAHKTFHGQGQWGRNKNKPVCTGVM